VKSLSILAGEQLHIC